MRRHKIVARIILLTLSVINFALAAPVLVREIREVRVDVVDETEDVTTALRKRWTPSDEWSTSAADRANVPLGLASSDPEPPIDLGASLHSSQGSTEWDNSHPLPVGSPPPAHNNLPLDLDLNATPQPSLLAPGPSRRPHAPSDSGPSTGVHPPSDPAPLTWADPPWDPGLSTWGHPSLEPAPSTWRHPLWDPGLSTWAYPPEDPAPSTLAHPPWDPGLSTLGHPPLEPAPSTWGHPPLEPAPSTWGHPPLEPVPSTMGHPPLEPVPSTWGHPLWDPGPSTWAYPPSDLGPSTWVHPPSDPTPDPPWGPAPLTWGHPMSDPRPSTRPDPPSDPGPSTSTPHPPLSPGTLQHESGDILSEIFRGRFKRRISGSRSVNAAQRELQGTLDSRDSTTEDCDKIFNAPAASTITSRHPPLCRNVLTQSPRPPPTLKETRAP